MYIRERRAAIIVSDLLVCAASAVIAVSVWLHRRQAVFHFSDIFDWSGWVVSFSLLTWSVLLMWGCHHSDVASRFSTSARRLTGAFLTLLFLYLGVYFISAQWYSEVNFIFFSIQLKEPLKMLRYFPALHMAVSFACLMVWHALYALVHEARPFSRRILVVGSGASGQTIMKTIAETRGTGYRLVGYVDEDPRGAGAEFDGIRELGGCGRLSEIITEHGVEEICLAIAEQGHGKMFQSLMDAYESGVLITPMPILYENLTGKVAVLHIGDQWYLSLPVSKYPSNTYNMLKRSVDVLFSIVGLCAVAVLVPLVWLGNLFFSRGPLFYRQVRLGRHGRPYSIIKFRSMVPGAEKECAVWAQENDDRVTKLGKLLRLARLDELPQFANVLKGEMSVVGPRPERPEFVGELAEKIPFYRSRHVVKPGLTGWAQVNYRYCNTVEDAMTKLQYDLYYIRNQSVGLDFRILMRTLLVVLRLKGM